MEIPNAMKFIIGIIAILFMGVIFYFVNWKPSLDVIKAKETELATITSSIEQANQELAQIETLKAERSKLQGELRSVIQEQLTPESESDFVPSYMADVERLVEHQRVRMNDPDFLVTTITPEGAGKGTSGVQALAAYPVRSFQMQLTGRYATVIDFLQQLGELKLKRLVTVSKITLSPSKQDDDYTKSPVLNVTLPISVYLRKETNN